MDLINKIKDINIPNNSFFISFDIQNMYSNIPTKETINILEKLLKNNNDMKPAQIKELIKLTEISLQQNYFEFNDCFYHQKEGLAIYDIFMNEIENSKIVNEANPYKNNLIYWYRYVDDIICLFQGNENEQHQFLSYLNSISKNIKFTIEKQFNEINFLDLTIMRQLQKHSFKIYRKPTQSDLIIPKDSNHPWTQKMASFRSLINRLIEVPMNEKDFKDELMTIKIIATKNGYKTKTIDKILQNSKNKNIYQPQKEDHQNFICVPHNTVLNKAIRNTFKNKNFKIGYKTNNNAFTILENLSKPKNKQINKYELSGLYKINCSDCPKFYIGQTGRTFKKRFNEHIQALRSNNSTSLKSTFAEHLLEDNHNYKNISENMKIIKVCEKNNKLDAIEELEIYINCKEDEKNLLNNMLTQKKNPIFDKILSIRKVNSRNN